MNSTNCCEAETSQLISLHCPVCGSLGMEIDKNGWFHCEDCCSLTPEAFERIMHGTLRRFSASRMENKAAAIAAEFGYTMEEIRGDMRCAAISRCRQQIYYQLRQDGLSFPQIGRICNKDHTSAMYGWKKVADALKAKAA